MKDIKVATVQGDQQPRSKCRKVGNEYYLIDRDIFLVEEMWYKAGSRKIIFDHEVKQWVLTEKNPQLTRGIVAIKDGKPEIGYFTPNKYNNAYAVVGNESPQLAISVEMLMDNNFIENVSDGTYYYKPVLTPGTIRKFQTPRNQMDNRNNPYNIEDGGRFEEMIEIFGKYKPQYTKDVLSFGKFLGDSTFGLEMETIRGYMPPHILNRCGLIVCRDGSLKDEDGSQGAEFVTVPMKGAKCLQNIRTICNELSKRALIDLNCSVHIHQGNLPTSRLYLASLYTLAVHIQDELFKIFPYYKTDPSGVKRMNWNQKLKPFTSGPLVDMTRDGYENYINGIYRRIFLFLSEGMYADSKFNRKNKRHPHRAKWERHSRYYWLNLMNTIFSDRNTVEYRPHPGSLNSQKIINWLFIINAISKYALVNAKKILTESKKTTLTEVLNYYADNFPGERAKFLSEYLNAYVESRKAEFKKCTDRGDYACIREITGDHDYEFNYKGVTHLF